METQSQGGVCTCHGYEIKITLEQHD